ncbi:MAG TPA: hypothetical protein VKP66_10170 [Steroidobacteraceae bacterium]|nr:hypothetical protein [Steroidobacteraceae bacterium]
MGDSIAKEIRGAHPRLVEVLPDAVVEHYHVELRPAAHRTR